MQVLAVNRESLPQVPMQSSCVCFQPRVTSKAQWKDAAPLKLQPRAATAYQRLDIIVVRQVFPLKIPSVSPSKFCDATSSAMVFDLRARLPLIWLNPSWSS